jgi:hypothetical protein
MQSEQYRDQMRELLITTYFGDTITDELEVRARLRLQEYLIPVVAVRFIDWNLIRVLMQDGSVATFGEMFGDYYDDHSPW